MIDADWSWTRFFVGMVVAIIVVYVLERWMTE